MIKGILGGILGVLLGFILIIFLIYLIIRILLNRHGFNGKSLKSIYDTIKRANALEKKRHKQVSGMTKLLLPEIQERFPDFNIEEIYLLVEKTIRAILNALEEKYISYLNDDEFSLIKEKINHRIIDLKENNVMYRYDDVIFHKHAIKSYKCQKGIAILEISSSLEYYYSKRVNEQDISHDDIKKQTRFTTELVYIIDSTKAGFDINVLGLNCPNCGSPITSLEQKQCSYCQSGTNIQIANLIKCWKVVNCKEDY